MLEAKTEFTLEPALTVASNSRHSNYLLPLDECVCLLVRALQYYLQREQMHFKIESLADLMVNYNTHQLSFMTQTESLLEQLVETKLIESSFDIGLISKLKTAKRFYQKAQSKLQAFGHLINHDEVILSATSNEEIICYYFHTMSSSLIHCLDVHMDANRFCELALVSYKRQAAAEEMEILPENRSEIELALSFLNENKQQYLKFREILVDANLHVSHDNILANVLNTLKNYLNLSSITFGA